MRISDWSSDVCSSDLFAMTGTHWWTMPENWPITEPLLRAIGQYNRYMSEQAPVEFARRLGAPVLQASHCGPLSGKYLVLPGTDLRSEEHTSELQSLMRTSYAVFCLKKTNKDTQQHKSIIM